MLILDDAIKPQDAQSTPRRQTANQWYDSTFYSRLDSKKDDVIIIVAQRVHVDDIVAHVKSKEEWVHINLPAIATVDEQFTLSNGIVVGRLAGKPLHLARKPIGVLEWTRATMGSFSYNAQYLQAPVPASGNLVSWEWFQVDEQEAPTTTATTGLSVRRGECVE